MTTKPFDLLERSQLFAADVRAFLKTVKVAIVNADDIKQLIRSSGSIGANYIESLDSLGKRNGLMHLRISRKEARECVYWLTILDVGEAVTLCETRKVLLREAKELLLILSSLIQKRALSSGS